MNVQLNGSGLRLGKDNLEESLEHGGKASEDCKDLKSKIFKLLASYTQFLDLN